MVALSDVGLQRTNNEDSYLVLDSQRLAVVADGMGGHLGGEVASRMVTSAISEQFHVSDGGSLQQTQDTLVATIESANSAIFKRGNADSRLRNMGTTVVAAQFSPSRVVYASVGDSRIYRYHDGRLRQTTEDHSWVGELRKKNLISEEDARNHPLKNIITRALGMESTVLVDANVADALPGDIFLLCSDGLTDLVLDSEIARIMGLHKDNLQAMASALIETANDLGGIDNITVLLCRIGEG